jgi:hypothetical protein
VNKRVWIVKYTPHYITKVHLRLILFSYILLSGFQGLSGYLLRHNAKDIKLKFLLDNI